MTEDQEIESLVYLHLGKLDPTILNMVKAAYVMGQQTPTHEPNVEVYSADQQRVADWLVNRSRGTIGGGTDPIGFLLASYEYQSEQLQDCLQLWDHCTFFVNDRDIGSEEDITLTDKVIFTADEFIKGICSIVGYKDHDKD